jgi:hypothetical protein
MLLLDVVSDVEEAFFFDLLLDVISDAEEAFFYGPLLDAAILQSIFLPPQVWQT